MSFKISRDSSPLSSTGRPRRIKSSMSMSSLPLRPAAHPLHRAEPAGNRLADPHAVGQQKVVAERADDPEHTHPLEAGRSLPEPAGIRRERGSNAVPESLGERQAVAD